ncbi:MAG: RNA polymerase sigma factor [Tannerella sp.]|jgi:RNA polymerase sigma factor (sigma-70 family)|nr:RNA polymerase sigma factor [Tannerella sp.]
MKNITLLYTSHAHALYSYAIRLGYSSDAAKDAVQDVFVLLMTKNISLPPAGEVRFFLLRIMKNKLINASKHEALSVRMSGEEDDEYPFHVDVSVEDEIIAREYDEALKRKIESMLGRLTNRQREIIYLRYMQGLEYEQIASVMGITYNSCRKLVAAAMVMLRKQDCR